MKIFITLGRGAVRDSFFTRRVVERLKRMGEVEFNETDSFGCDKETLMQKIKGTDVLFTGWGAPRIDDMVLSCADRLKIHAHTGGTVAPYVSKEEYDRGIHVLSGNDLYAKSVAEGCLVYTLASLRRIDEYIGAMKAGKWRPEKDHTLGLIRKKVGIVGYGAIGKYYADLLKWFEVELFVYSKYITDEELRRIGAVRASKEDIFSTCDIISLHSALNAENRGMITKDLIQMISDGALFVNTARSGLADTSALIDELKKNRFKAVLDVYDEEPLTADSALRNLPNVLLFPHMAGPTFDMREQVVMSLIDDIENITKNKPYRMGIDYDYAVRMTQ